MMQLIIDHLWQSTLFAAAAGGLTLLLRDNAARIRYWVWFAASLKFLVPFSALARIGESLAPQASFAAPSAIVFAIDVISAPAAPAASFSVAALAFTLWGAGSLAMIGLWLRHYAKIAAVVRTARPSALEAPLPVKLVGREIEPSLVGILRPVLLLPADLVSRLGERELASVIAHEVSHYRRRDNLTAAVHMLVQAAFWFHPLVWWIGARLVEERERACDEAVIASGNEAGAYAEAILKVCKFYVGSPLACVPGVSGGDLRRRIEQIVTDRKALELGRAKRTLLATACIAVVTVPVLMGAQAAEYKLLLPNNLPRQVFESAQEISFDDFMAALGRRDVAEVMLTPDNGARGNTVILGADPNGALFRLSVRSDPSLAAKLRDQGVVVMLPPRANPGAPNAGPAEIYPADSKAAREEGTAVLQLLVAPQGNVIEAVVEQSTGHPRLDFAAVVTAMDRWKFTPGSVNDVPTEMRMRIRINFKLPPEEAKPN